MVEKQFAYGVSHEAVAGKPGTYALKLVALAERSVTMFLDAAGKLHATILINGKQVDLVRIFVHAVDRTLRLPKVEYIDLVGQVSSEHRTHTHTHTHTHALVALSADASAHESTATPVVVSTQLVVPRAATLVQSLSAHITLVVLLFLRVVVCSGRDWSVRSRAHHPQVNASCARLIRTTMTAPSSMRIACELVR